MPLKEQLKHHEGFVPHAYRDSRGYLTIGYGRLIDESLGGGITREEADILLDNDIARARNEARQLEWFDRLDSVRQDAILNMIFNMGMPRLLGFKKMISAIKSMDWDEAKRQAIDSQWAAQVGPRAETVTEQLRTGVEH